VVNVGNNGNVAKFVSSFMGGHETILWGPFGKSGIVAESIQKYPPYPPYFAPIILFIYHLTIFSTITYMQTQAAKHSPALPHF
jgi:hypothetical protein